MAIGQQAIPPASDSAFSVFADETCPSVSTDVLVGSGASAGGVIIAPPSVLAGGYAVADVGVATVAVGAGGVSVGRLVGVTVGVAVGQPPPSARAGVGRIAAVHRISQNKMSVRFME